VFKVEEHGRDVCEVGMSSAANSGTEWECNCTEKYVLYMCFIELYL